VQTNETRHSSALLDAAQVADLLHVERGFVYARKDELGAIKLGSGPKARLRFRPEAVEEYLAHRKLRSASAELSAMPKRSRQRQSSARTVELLPIKGKAPPGRAA
jgi:hypothetical protein